MEWWHRDTDRSIPQLNTITSDLWIRFPNMMGLLRRVTRFTYECNTGIASTAKRYKMQKYRNAFDRNRGQVCSYFPSDIE